MKRLSWGVFVSGIAAVIGQTLIIREGLALFVGNELISGILLSFWLFWTGLGSLIFPKLNLKKEPLNCYSFLLFALSLFLIFSITFFRLAPKIFSLPFGEIMSLDKIILISLISLAPTCLIFGALFPAAAKILAPQKVYLFEGLGSFLGGLLISFILIRVLPPFGILAIIVSLLLFSGLIIIDNRRRIFLIFSLLPLLFLIKIYNLELFFRKTQMLGQNLIALKETKYGVISVTEAPGQLNFYTNGLYDFSFPDLYTAEEAVHYPLLLHKSPQRVLLVGGGMGNAITQILKHPMVADLIYLELDPWLFKIGEKYTGEDLKKIKKLKTIFGDARFYIKNTQEQYDVLIINLPDPVNGQINRFYTKEFFEEIKSVLKPDGLLSVRITSPPDIVSPIFAQYLKTVYNTLKSSFNNIVVLPAAKKTFIAGPLINQIDIVEILKKNITERNLHLTYVNGYFIDYNFTREKLAYLKTAIEQVNAPLNTDLRPVCYYFGNTLWGYIVAENLKRLFIKLHHLNPILFFLPLVLVFVFFRRKTIIYLSVFSIGATEISAEVILLILFQVLYGYIYGWIGILIGFYMFGLTIGTLFFLKSKYFAGNLINILSRVQFLIALYAILILLSAITKIPGSNYLISLLIFSGGFLGGIHFPLSIGILGKEKAGNIYGIDLFGSSLGALVVALMLIPILGIPYTLLIFILLNLLVTIGLRTVSSI